MKKMTAKDRRALELEKRKQKIDKIQQEKRDQDEKEQKKQEEEQRRKEKAEYDEIAKRLEKKEGNSSRKKSRAKAAGLKSTFIIDDDKLLMTSFGTGATACLEKYIEDKGRKISNATEDPSLNVSKKDIQFSISGRNSQNAVTDNPLRTYSKSYIKKAEKLDDKEVNQTKKMPGDDLIYCRRNLEQIYFGEGKQFKDNIHIQLIYNILDIEKILSVHVNNIVFELNNLLRRDLSEHDDLIGYMSLTRGNYEKFKGREEYALFKELLKKSQLGYFGSVMLPPVKTKKMGDEEYSDKMEEYERKMYYMFSLLGQIRQATAHGDIKTRASLYTMEQSCKVNMQEAKALLDNMYREQINSLNDDFVKNASNDIYILSKMYPDMEKQELAEKYYSFVVRKDYKNLGFSIRRLREVLLEKNAADLKDERYDSVRRRIYRLMDFVITSYYLQDKNQKHRETLVDNLRSCRTEAEKFDVYYYEAKALYPNIMDMIKTHIAKIDGDYIHDISGTEYEKSLIKEALIPQNGNFFSEIIYFLTIFLDGKEINDLLTQLINKFENIHSFFEILEKEKLDTTLSSDYTLFYDSKVIADELRVINNVARMTKPEASTRKIMFLEAAQLLGYDEDEEKLSKYIDAMLSKDTAAWKEAGIKNGGFRNFIINNVIESNRFKYLVRYGNPKKLRALANNEKVVEYVLKQGILDNQILRYYNSCNETKLSLNKEYTAEEYDNMRENLKNKIVNVRFSNYSTIPKGNMLNSAESAEKERSKSIVRLYLTVLYLLLKNLVYINSRYFLAFHCLERDYYVYNYGKDCNDNDLKSNFKAFTEQFLMEHPLNYRAQKYVLNNIEHSDSWVVNAYRNCCDHLTAIRNANEYIEDIKEVTSYFELYHYLVQRSLYNQYEYDSNTDSKKNPGKKIIETRDINPVVLKYFEKVEKYHSYCKDFVKALNVPFAYNLPRYKNLSIKELFDRNDYNSKEGRKVEIEE